MEYYSAIKNAIMQVAGKWIELEKKIILSEVIQTQKDKYVFTYMWILALRQ